MTWQEAVFAGAGWATVVALCPTIKRRQFPALATSVPGAVIALCVMVALGSLGMWSGVLANGLAALLWGTIVVMTVRSPTPVTATDMPCRCGTVRAPG
ncbi:hypothetical protein [Conexibacter woesei]|uniref:Uncharacterized protein n=1 Tax=Conexibacter woesei (strain DSM 14684 / CCUG 47730 / CIP 108061 / JCM 11494 / NBRC 100937 / ID131577) TaxID=469383 RepID=D3EZ22_CONWI|nr:hypothetical protein [Conexibacter woesei]ADB49896.1 hypothetical protein Cwoe_1468 [Conexibacter woesei DSM 14684]